LKAACDPKKLFRKPDINVQWRKFTNEREGKLEQKLDAAIGKKLKN
jgi:hypothetical protein